jgi:fatty-acyl-CoA synthase
MADGELFIVDRLKDLLVIGGRNYFPGDLERVVGAVAGVRRGAVVAFAARGDHGTEHAYVVAAVEAGVRDKQALVSAIQAELRSRIGLSVERVYIVRPGRLPRTSSGKLRRSMCSAMLRSGQLETENLLDSDGRLTPAASNHHGAASEG